MVSSFSRLVKQCLWMGPAVLVFNDLFASTCLIEGRSMQPTFNPGGNSFSDRVIIEKWSVRRYRYQRGDVVVLR